MRRIVPMLAMLQCAVASNAHAACEPLDSCACGVRASPVQFGAYNAFNNTPTDSIGSIEVNCSVSTPTVSLTYEIRLSTGDSGSFSPRRLAGPTGGHLSYNLYSDASRNQVWGDGSGSTTSVSGGFSVLLPSNNIAEHPVYARVDEGQLGADSGNYSDTIQVTIIY